MKRILRIGWVTTVGDKTAFGGWEFEDSDQPQIPTFDEFSQTIFHGYTMNELFEIAARHLEWGVSKVDKPVGIEEELRDSE